MAEALFVARKERDGWLLFDTVRHSVTTVDEARVNDLEAVGRIVRRIERPLVEGAMSAPLKLFLSVSNRCNLTCSHCMSDSSPAGRIEPTTEELLTLIDEAADMGIFLIIVGGGEPLMRPDLWELVERMRSHNIGVSLTTNGTVLRDDDIRNFLKFQVRLNVSIDGGEQTHDRIRNRKGAFQRTVANMRRFIAAGVTPTIRFTLLHSNLADVDEVLVLAQDLNVPIKPRRAKPAGRVLEGSDIITEPTPEYFAAVVKLNEAPNCGVEDLMNINAAAKDSLLLSDDDCGAGTRVMFVDERGIVSPCTFLGQDFESGTWRPGMLTDYWRSAPAFETMRNLVANEECGTCSRHRTCHAECPAMRLHTSGRLDGPDPGCIKPLLVTLGAPRYKDV